MELNRFIWLAQNHIVAADGRQRASFSLGIGRLAPEWQSSLIARNCLAASVRRSGLFDLLSLAEDGKCLHAFPVLRCGLTRAFCSESVTTLCERGYFQAERSRRFRNREHSMRITHELLAIGGIECGGKLRALRLNDRAVELAGFEGD